MPMRGKPGLGNGGLGINLKAVKDKNAEGGGADF